MATLVLGPTSTKRLAIALGASSQQNKLFLNNFSNFYNFYNFQKWALKYVFSMFWVGFEVGIGFSVKNNA